MNNIYSAKAARIRKIIKHTDKEWSFVLEFKAQVVPGQFVIVSIPGFGEAPISVSSFSLDSIELMIRNVGKVTSGIFALKVGNAFFVRGPYGNPFPLEKFNHQHLLIIAGGSALAAARPVIEYYLGKDFDQLKQLSILAGFRSPKHVLFRRQIDLWSKKCKVIVTVDTDEDESWMGGVGFVVEFIKDIEHMDSATNVVIIGPPLMMRNSVRELLSQGVKEENIWLSYERHMKCGLGKCGHCRIKDKYVCLDGPIFSYLEAKSLVD